MHTYSRTPFPVILDLLTKLFARRLVLIYPTLHAINAGYTISVTIEIENNPDENAQRHTFEGLTLEQLNVLALKFEF